MSRLYSDSSTPTNQAPTVASAAAAAPNPVTGTSTSLSVLGADDGGASALIYTWAATAVPTGGAANFSANGTNAASNRSVSFTKAGAYTLRATIQDSGGSISSGGLFTAGGAAGGPFTVTVTSGAIAGNAQVTVSTVAPQPDVTVDFELLSDSVDLTSHGGITWGTGGGGWKVWDSGAAYTKNAYLLSTSKTEVTSTFVLPAGRVLKSLRIAAASGGTATVKISSPGNAESVYTDINGTYQTKTLNWVPDQTVTVKIISTAVEGASDVIFDNLVYGVP